MWDMFSMVASNVNMTFENIITLLVTLGGFIFYARDVRLGLVLHMVMYSLVFMWFYEAGLNYSMPIILMFISLVFLAFTLYAVSKSSRVGSII